MFNATTQRSLNILPWHWKDLAFSFGDQGICSLATFYENRILSKTIHLFQINIFLLYRHNTLFDDVKWVGVVSLAENYLSLFISLWKASWSDSVFLLFCQVLEKRQDSKKLFVFLFIGWINILHNLFKDLPVHFYKVAFGQGEYTGRSRGTINNAQITEGIPKGKCLFLFIINLNLARPF